MGLMVDGSRLKRQTLVTWMDGLGKMGVVAVGIYYLSGARTVIRLVALSLGGIQGSQKHTTSAI